VTVGRKRQFFYKQLADVVESVTGAATIACGLNFTQEYLRTIGILKHQQENLGDHLDGLT
jgi:hypothetical protein